MYYPYFRGKKFELEAIHDVSSKIFKNTIPVVEPINTSRDSIKAYKKIAASEIPIVIITNPRYSIGDPLDEAEVYSEIINGALGPNSNVILGLIFDEHSDIGHFLGFIKENPTYKKAIVFNVTPDGKTMLKVDSYLRIYDVDILIFEEDKTTPAFRSSLAWHGNRVLLTDGFDRKRKNALYPASSMFETRARVFRGDNFQGVGDYLTIGDHFKEPAPAQAMVVTFHISAPTVRKARVYHFSSTVLSSQKGHVPPKFKEACELVVTSPLTASIMTSGMEVFRYWHSKAHSGHLGAAIKASLMNHMEVISEMV